MSYAHNLLDVSETAHALVREKVRSNGVQRAYAATWVAPKAVCSPSNHARETDVVAAHFASRKQLRS
jgi:hypothetical protein